MVKRNSLASSAVVSPVAATATAMLWSEIIFPITPAAEFTEAVRMGFNPSALAVITWRLPKSAFDEVSLPVRNTPSHPRIALKELESRGFSPELVRAVASHADYLEVSRDTPMEKTLFAVDELSGFVMACAYVRPTGIHGLTPKSVKKKMKTPAFAAAVDRDELREGAAELGVDFDEHLAFVIAALEERADELELNGSAAHA